jgi:hypothetical protein
MYNLHASCLVNVAALFVGWEVNNSVTYICMLHNVQPKHGENIVIRVQLTYLLTYIVTSWSRVLLEKVTSSQLVEKFPELYGTQSFTTAFTSAHHLSLF